MHALILRIRPGFDQVFESPTASATWPECTWLTGWLADSLLTFQICSFGSSSSKLKASLRLLNEWYYAMDAHEVSEHPKNEKIIQKKETGKRNEHTTNFFKPNPSHTNIDIFGQVSRVFKWPANDTYNWPVQLENCIS